jgi:hypothetical protein
MIRCIKFRAYEKNTLTIARTLRRAMSGAFFSEQQEDLPMAKAATWPHAGVHTVRELQRRHRRLDRRVNAANAVIACMRRGARLYLTFQRSGPTWVLSDGRKISDEVARLVIADHRVGGVGTVCFEA